MRYSRRVVSSLLLLANARGFTRPSLRPSFGMVRSSTTALNANVVKLSDPHREILEKVDVFIFDCDGVIWRVSCCLEASAT